MSGLAVTTVAILALLAASRPPRATAGGYYGGYNYHRPTYYPSYSYGYSYPSYFNYYPTYYYPTLPTYSYYSYQQPTYYYATNYYDGAYHWHDAGYWRGSYYPAGYYRWYNGYWQAQASYSAPSYSRGDWKSQLLELAAARDQVEGEIRKNAADSQAFNQAISALGLQGNFHYDNYGQYPGFPYHQSFVNGNPSLGTYGANGSTIYGYTLNSIKDVYGSSDVNTLFQQAQRLAQNAQSLGGQATTEFQTAITQEGNNRSRVAEILARSQAAAEALRAAEGTPPRTSSSTSIRSGQSSTQEQQGADGPPSDGAQQQQGPRITPEFAQLATQKCLKCHGPEKTEAKFDVRTYPGLAVADKEKVWNRIMSTDKDKLMPKGGPPLSAAEKRIFFTN